MSRIERALEKAALLRQPHHKGGSVQAGTPVQNKAPVSTRPQLPPAEAIEDLSITNPFLATCSDPHSPVSEEYRKLKSAIVSLTTQGSFRNTIMVTSSVGNEGKSITSLNLAVTLAQEYDHTVLLVDADLRKPSIHGYLELKPDKGLAECLTGKASVSDVLIRTGIGRLTLLPAGTPMRNPVEPLSSQIMKDLIDEIKHRYNDRYIIIDTPPVLPFAETRFLGALVDGIVFVVREGVAGIEDVGAAIGALQRNKMLGIVYNDATTESLAGRYHYYYNGYDQPAGSPEERLPDADSGIRAGGRGAQSLTLLKKLFRR